MQRGEIRHPEIAGQLRDFRGLRFGTITPTDFDGFIDYHNKIHIYMESKYGDAELPFGQRLALERVVDECKVTCTAVIVSHNHPPTESIDFANTRVVEYRWHKEWRKPVKPGTCREFIEAMIGYVDDRSN